MILQKIQPERKDLFFKDLSASVSASPAKEAFVFVHGYNESFEDAAIRTAQLAYDFGFKGAPIFYSWPSEGRLLGYFGRSIRAVSARLPLASQRNLRYQKPPRVVPRPRPAQTQNTAWTGRSTPPPANAPPS
jgi:hypothetical protein